MYTKLPLFPKKRPDLKNASTYSDYGIYDVG